jgi:hypothetical protein
VALTSTFWRNAWRYKGRAYRHTFWDTGTTMANLLSVAASIELPTRVVLGYADAQVNELLGVDGRHEATVALCAIGRTEQAAPAAPELTPLDYQVRAISPGEVEFPVIGMLHDASMLESGADAAAWRAEPLLRAEPDMTGPTTNLQPIAAGELPELRIEEIIFKRRSTRHYDTGIQIPFSAFSTLLERSSRGFSADCLNPDAPPLHECYLIVNGVNQLEPGVYRHWPQRGQLELLRAGDYRRRSALRGRGARQRLLPDQSRPGAGTLRQSGLPVGAARARHLRRKAAPGHARAGARRGRLDLVR